jgi:hypothetical protein
LDKTAEGDLDEAVVRRQVEAWLIADAETLANHLRVASRRVPNNPDALESSKTAMVNLARHSKSSAIREDMTPREGVDVPSDPRIGDLSAPLGPRRCAESI